MKLNLIGPINTLGYGYTVYNILRELNKMHDVAFYPIGTPEKMVDGGFVERCIDNQTNLWTDAPCIRIWHQHELQQFVGKGSHIGFPIFELDKFNPLEITSLRHCDKIFVCSEWAKSVVVNNLRSYDKDISEKVYVVPLGVDTSIFKPVEPSRRPQTVFYNCGKWEIRKGHDVILNAFNNAFSPTDNVELWMMCDNPFIGEKNNEWINAYKNSPLGDKIRIIPRQNTHEDVYNIMKQADVGLFPARAEGWNLELLEMLTIGKHVITTDYSAHTEFCNSDNARLITVDTVEPAVDGIWFHGQGNWANLGDDQLEQTISHMRDLHSLKQSGDLNQNTQGISTGQAFTWGNSVSQLIQGV